MNLLRSSNKMKLLDLPPELLHEILMEAVLLRGLKRAMRMRLVNKRFSQDVLQAVFETHLPDTRTGYSLSKGSIWQSYLIYRVWTEKENTSSLFTIIRRTSKSLCQSTGKSDEITLRAHIDHLSCLAVNRIHLGVMRGLGIVSPSRSIFAVFDPVIFDNEATWASHLLVAAAYTNDKATVQKLLAEGCNPAERSLVFGSATRAAAVQGNNEILLILLTSMLGSEHFLHAICAGIRGATEGGNLATLNIVLDTRWGYISPSRKIYSQALRNGLRTKNPEVYNRIARVASPDICLPALLAQASASGYIKKVAHLIKEGAFVNGDRNNPAANPLRCASLKGHTDIVKLLLEHGARPCFGWGDTLASAAKSGYLDIVRILLAHGANVNENPPEIFRAPPAIISAIQLEHEEMFCFLRKKGATLNIPKIGGKALEIAIKQGLESMVVLLLHESVDMNDSHIETATKHRQYEIAKILRQPPEIPPNNSYADLAWQSIQNALAKTTSFGSTFNARKEKTHSTQRRQHSA